jgi:hypothetical protein
MDLDWAVLQRRATATSLSSKGRAARATLPASLPMQLGSECRPRGARPLPPLLTSVAGCKSVRARAACASARRGRSARRSDESGPTGNECGTRAACATHACGARLQFRAFRSAPFCAFRRPERSARFGPGRARGGVTAGPSGMGRGARIADWTRRGSNLAVPHGFGPQWP